MTDIIRYESHIFNIAYISSFLYLRGNQLASPLGLSHGAKATNTIYRRNKSKFTSDMSRVVNMPTRGGTQMMRLFSLEGAKLLAELANTPKAPAFLAWLEKMDENGSQHLPALVSSSIPALPAPERPKNLRALSKEARIVLKCRSVGLTTAETMGAARLTRSGVEDISASLRSFGLLAVHHG